MGNLRTIIFRKTRFCRGYLFYRMVSSHTYMTWESWIWSKLFLGNILEQVNFPEYDETLGIHMYSDKEICFVFSI